MPSPKIMLALSASGLLAMLGVLKRHSQELTYLFPNGNSSNPDCQYSRIPRYLHEIILPVGCGFQRPVKTSESPFPGYTFKSLQGKSRYNVESLIKDYERQLYQLPRLREVLKQALTECGSILNRSLKY